MLMRQIRLQISLMDGLQGLVGCAQIDGSQTIYELLGIKSALSEQNLAGIHNRLEKHFRQGFSDEKYVRPRLGSIIDGLLFGEALGLLEKLLGISLQRRQLAAGGDTLNQLGGLLDKLVQHTSLFIHKHAFKKQSNPGGTTGGTVHNRVVCRAGKADGRGLPLFFANQALWSAITRTRSINHLHSLF
jgi:hypothetical protein